ncbi:hypothetical protein BDW60DRAFT_218347 [Aspergillus nidulans var. acristatus]
MPTRRQRVCPWCLKSFTQEEHLARHACTHTKEKTFICTECNKSFSRHDSLLRHIRSHKPGESLSPRAANASSSDTMNLNIPSPSRNSHSQAESREPALDLRAPQAFEYRPSLDSPSDIPMQQHPSHPTFAEVLTDHHSPSAATIDQTDWVFHLVPETPAWLAQEDFDLDALKSAVMTSENQLLLPSEPLPPIEGLTDQHAHALARDMPLPIEDTVQREWFTYTRFSKSGYITPEIGPEQTQVDEMYRAHLAVKLQHHIPVSPLPSTDFLNMCIQTYFTQFHPLFPVIHAPTFRPSANRSLLLLSICSIGSLIVGLAHAKAQGVKIFETLNKAILSSWETILSRKGAAATPMIQAALIGQTFGLLSGRQKDLFIAQTFHGTLLAASDGISLDEIRHDPQGAWRKWVLAEEQNRIAAALHIHDIEIAELFVTDPYLRHCVPERPILSDEELWAAPTAQECSDSSIPQMPTPRLHAYLELEGIAASIIESSSLGLGSSSNSKSNHGMQEQPIDHIVAILIRFYTLHLKPHTHARDPFSLLALWHSIFISVFTNIDSLELDIGKERYHQAVSPPVTGYVRAWAASPNGQRSALHAALILGHLKQLSLATEPAIHVPRVLFRAAITWYCYTKYQSRSEAAQPQPQQQAAHVVQFPELREMIDGVAVRKSAMAESSIFCGLVDLLQRMGHWGLSTRLAGILRLLLPDGDQEER